MATVSLPSGENFVLNPTSVALATQDNYVSSLTTLAMHKREVDERLIQRYGKQGITGLLELVGAKKSAHKHNLNTSKKRLYTTQLLWIITVLTHKKTH